MSRLHSGEADARERGVVKRRRSGGRAGRNPAISSRGPAGRAIPSYEILTAEALERIEAQADWILQEIGIEFRGDDIALSLFRESGATVNGATVRFDPGHVRALCSTAPSEFTLHGRDASKNVRIGGSNLVLMPGYGSPFVTDLDRGRRYASLEDFHNFVRLTYMSPWLHHSGGTVCEPVDVPVNKRHLDMVHAHLTQSTKPFMGGVTSASRASDSIEMTRIVHGADFVDKNAVVQANINVNSPLVYDDTMSAALRVYAAANQCVAVSPAIFGGAMGPLGPAAMAAQTLAEGMVGIALTQLVRPGCPCVFGSFHSTMNLKSGALTFGSPEANLTTFALAQLGRHLGVPVRSGGGQLTAANAGDGQAMQESTSAMWAAILSGANQVWHAAGWLEGGLTMSYEKFVMDLDHCGAMIRMVQGFSTDTEAMGRDAYKEVGPGQNFLSTAHTLRHFRDANFLPELPEAGPYETWVEAGSKTLEQRANARWKTMLDSYEKPPLDPGVAEALDDYAARRKSEMKDKWY
ncbi:MAG: trimethylamine methyltransferase [Gammaproteobacteria bacterium]|nr:trimethylamine methyltransferase [Gammaproteobacteria bacterium]